MKIIEVKNLPEQFASLAEEAFQDGHHFLIKMNEEWKTNKNRFERDREILFSMVTDSGDLVGIGGLNIDPYADDPTIGRVRHVYVAKDYRGQGAGKLLVQRIMDHARGRFQTLRLKTHNSEAMRLYEALGFKIEANSDATHFYMQMMLR